LQEIKGCHSKEMYNVSKDIDFKYFLSTKSAY